VYRSLIPEGMRAVKRFGTNSIERMNLTLRTRLKRLGRRTICYTKSLAMLWACAAIACWG
jgi:IS1 family transposase